MLKWQSEYSVGIGALDLEHRKIISMINAIEEAGADERQSVGRDVINRVAVYVDRHFRAEEDAMRSAGYPHLEAHMKSHNDFTNKVLQLRDRVDLDTEELKALLMNWLLEHIMKADHDYGPCIQSWLKDFEAKRASAR